VRFVEEGINSTTRGHMRIRNEIGRGTVGDGNPGFTRGERKKRESGWRRGCIMVRK